MADAEVATPEQIAEYESQLSNIDLLLAESPEDESLFALKNDLVELLQLTKASSTSTSDLPPPPEEDDDDDDDDDNDDDDDLPLPSAPPSSEVDTAHAAVAVGTAAATAATTKKSNKKKKKIKEFVAPPNLIVNETTDSDAEKKRKWRKLKQLKSQWRAKNKEVQSDNRQKSWQSFQKKTSSKSSSATSSSTNSKKRGGASDGSIFSTQEGVNDRVGVISKKQMTGFGERKRHKQI